MVAPSVNSLESPPSEIPEFSLSERAVTPDDGAARTQVPGCQQRSCGSFEEEEEGAGVASDVLKVQGEDPATPGPLIQGMTP